jgi:hypothetical protein
MRRSWFDRSHEHTTAHPWPSTDTVVVTDAGLETWLVFDHDVDLPAFAISGGEAVGRALLLGTTVLRRHRQSIASRSAGERPRSAQPIGPPRSATIASSLQFIAASVAVVDECVGAGQATSRS